LLLRYFTSPEALRVMQANGLQPASAN
jgi:hypothetical protein